MTTINYKTHYALREYKNYKGISNSRFYKPRKEQLMEFAFPTLKMAEAFARYNHIRYVLDLLPSPVSDELF